jgi:hypothetical protein
MAANDKQISGSHYKQRSPEPWDVVAAWDMGYLDGSALKYIARWRYKNGISDLQKAIHFLEKLIEVELGRERKHEEEKNGPYVSRPKEPTHP